MATIESPPNSVWPNGLQTDSEGYVNFYPLGTNKIDISTITWPEGTEVKSPFVYQNDKLVGFIDTKALEIDNNDTTIDINYTHFDADLDSIMENTLTINAPANAAVNVKYGAVDKVLTEKIEKLIGKEKCEVKFDKNNNKATIAVPFDTAEAQLADVQTLLDRVLPSNIVVEIDPFPLDFTRVEYLQSTTYDTHIKLGYYSRTSDVTEITMTPVAFETHWNVIFGSVGTISYCLTASALNNNHNTGRVMYGKSDTGYPVPQELQVAGTKRIYVFDKNELFLNGENVRTLTFSELQCEYESYLFRANYPEESGGSGFYGSGNNKRIYEFNISNNDVYILKFVPALDNTGAPCMFDLVTRTPFYNAGTGSFISGIETQQQLDNLLNSFPNYTGQAIENMQINLAEALQTPENEAHLAEAMAQNSTIPAMLSLDEEFVAPKFYAKLTEHGVRRLYHVPKGYTGTMDDYAAANGFKELVEPPMPFEGYWRPEWRETETQLICDWVETEPPTEEVETLNNED